MSYRIADLDAEAEVLLTRAEWDAARRKFLTWAGRDDRLYPLPVPEGTTWARRVTDLRPGRPGQNESVLVYGEPWTDVAVPPGATPDGGALLPRPDGDVVQGASFFQPNRAQWVGKWTADAVPYRASGVPVPSAGWWYESAWGRDLAYAFLPTTAVSGPFVVGPSDIHPFGDALETDVVLVRSPHPYLPAEAIERQRAGPDVWAGGGPNRALRTPVRSRGLSFVRGPGHVAMRGPDGWLGKLYRRASESEVEGVVDSVEGMLETAGAIVSGAGRNLLLAARGDLGALQSLAAAALATAVAGPAGLSLLGSDDPWRDAARLGALHYALWISPLTQAARGGNMVGPPVAPYAGSASAAQALVSQPVAAGINDLSKPSFHILGGSYTADAVAAAEVWAQRLMIVNPDEANRILQKLVLEGGFVDLLLARLVIEAERSADKREALKARVAAKQAEFNDKYLKYITAALAVIPALGWALAVASILYQAGVALAGVEVALRNARQAELALDREMRAIEAEIARIQAEIAAAGLLDGVPAGTDAPSSGGEAVGGQAEAARWRAWLEGYIEYFTRT